MFASFSAFFGSLNDGMWIVIDGGQYGVIVLDNVAIDCGCGRAASGLQLVIFGVLLFQYWR